MVLITKSAKNKKAPLMELRSFLRVGIKLVMTTTMTLFNQNKGEDAICNRINVLYVATQTQDILEYETENHTVENVLRSKENRLKIYIIIQSCLSCNFLICCGLSRVV